MSLDVFLHQEGLQVIRRPNRIFVREDGATREITRAEWNRRYPGREPATVTDPEPTDCVYSANITHNLGRMAQAAGLYGVLWEPETCGVAQASQLLEPLRIGHTVLMGDPRYFQRFNPSNGWGNYGTLLAFVSQYYVACEQWPEARVSVSR